jgi:hypothetical protein
MTKIYLADRECKVNASEALQEIDKQYLGWGWNTEQTTLDLVDYAKALECQLEGAMDLAESAIDLAFGMDADVSFLEEWLEQLKEKGE